MIRLIKYLWLSMRPKHWVKNLFIFLPLVFGRKLFIFPTNLKTAIGFILFSLAASSVYLFNDILDMQKDKLHPIKRHRPISAGNISLRQAAFLACFLGIASLISAFILEKYFGLVVLSYFIFNLIYMKLLKEVVIIDVFCLSIFFLLRIMAGIVIVKTEFSYWIIFMTILLALFLGLNKRRQELQLFKKSAASHRQVLSKYTPYFIDQMIAIITSSIVVVYMLYTIDARTVNIFGTNHLMYSIPFVYYGIFRYLYLIHKVRKDGDPTYILLSDPQMRLNLALWVAVCIAVIYFGL